MTKICVLGLGYIGLPTASILATHGFEVVGVDVDVRVVQIVNNGGLPIEEPGLKTIVKKDFLIPLLEGSWRRTTSCAYENDLGRG